MAVNPINSIDTNSFSISQIDFSENKKNESIAGAFGEFLNNAMNEISELERQSSYIAEEFAAGRTDNIHQVMIAAQKVDIALQFTMQIRNKILDAYNEIMRIQI
ncbi:MAG: flagellar hook-basal body complex protein FliE [Clostridium sp.]|jgi:flagellar hook-basal body complex protein FliE|nr:flagellar hook-basal body complex protein FliE [Clostridium sp.]